MGDQYITYNEFVFPFTRLQVTQSPVMAEDKITQLGTEYNITVTGTIAANTQTAFTTQINTMRAKLSQPGKDFWATNDSGDGSGAHDYYKFLAGVQADWGPFPGPLQLSDFAGGLACRYSWTLRAFQHDCYTGTCSFSGNGGDILAFMRKFDYRVDTNGFTTRTVSGKLIVSAVAVRANRNADQYRFFVRPVLPVNFQPIDQSFSLSEDGTELSFNFVDAEQMYTLPDPITEGNASFMVKVAASGGLINYALSGYFAAPATVDKSLIVTRILDLAEKYFPAGQTNFFFEQREFRSSVYHPNRIDFNITATSSAGTTADGQYDFNTGMDTLTGNPPNSNGYAHPVGPYGGDSAGDSGVNSPSPIRYDSCAPVSFSNTGLESGGIVPVEGGGSRQDGTIVPPVTGGISPEQKANPWVAYHERLSYEVDNGLVFFEPKNLKTNPIMQQARPPSLVLVQAGYAMRYGTDPSTGPSAPQPVGSGSAWAMLSASVQPSNPEPIGDGSTLRMTLHWRYVMRYARAFGLGLLDAEPVYPLDPRLANQTIDLSDEIPNSLGLVVIPGTSGGGVVPSS